MFLTLGKFSFFRAEKTIRTTFGRRHFVLNMSLFKLSYDKIMHSGYDSDCDKDGFDDILLNDIIDSEDSSGEVPPKQCSSGVFTSVHLDEGYVDVDFITEQLVEKPKEKSSILISDTGVPINWDDQHW